MAFDIDRDRRTGRSFRTCLRVVYAASDRPNVKIICVFPTHAMARVQMRLFRSILSGIQGCSFTKDTVHLPNGSVITLRGDNDLIGIDRRQIQVFSDHLFP